ncbi:Glycerophosphoryl diester phosphodiesterase family protein [Trichomonas vaginalis G3]|uniref:Glycerophosphoryl diester phosphodiesterase family protein n=1 Tax=Trichomonas vaginalis (strain ATCC PRA-98 / G3) TaxID=412133 RepID=A2F4M8_TRIV3|nr:glycerophosphocholine phosphodiesterase protein [Trichomonas vaginalis G3]EAY00133.1 Glycerophosphoryl diester phosphodiesterase family protein [Trichomonas vaginalis G3]KAI5522735.1 glycerophosphocholine phosphodiesterase protein [Trichomonas vaginalis G3]|eukprot:XP_001313062.1 Glycerophosphoryl diester phosphodiesterase family protein [Trichomonas vaginalis G3]
MYSVVFVETERSGEFVCEVPIPGLKTFSTNPFFIGIYTFYQRPNNFELKVPCTIGNQKGYILLYSELQNVGFYHCPVFLEDGAKSKYWSSFDIQLVTSNISNMYAHVKLGFDNLLCIGHRGFGMNKVSPSILENTVTSFNHAMKHGSDMIELDVQFTKDQIPVIFHDFTIKCNKSIPNEKPVSEENGIYEYAVYQLTLEQLHNWGIESNYKTPIPSLQEILTQVPESSPMDIEVKAIHEEIRLFNKVAYPERNMFVDSVLSVIDKYIGSRNIIFSTFDLMTAIMLKLKQNKFPVLQLSCVEDFEPEIVGMSRLMACINAHKDLGINGFVLDSELVLKYKDMATNIVNQNYALFTYGKGNYEEKTVLEQLKMGVRGICTDFCEPISKVVHSHM